MENSEVWRHGRTATITHQERQQGQPTRAVVRNRHFLKRRMRDHGITISTEIASKGGGVTEIAVFIPVADFARLEHEMDLAKRDYEQTQKISSSPGLPPG